MPPRVAALAVCLLAYSAVGQDPDRRDAAINSPAHQAAMARPVAECEALAKQDRPGLDFTACRNLRGANLEGLNLAEAILDYADLTGARLGRANLMRISAQYASFERINGEGVKLDESDLRGTTFRKANLQYAKMTGPAIAHADFSDADLRHANIRALYDADSVNFDRVDLRDTTVTDCHLHYGSFEDAKLQGSKYEDISFFFSFFGGATWTGAVMSDMGFEGANLMNTNFDGCTLDQVRWAGAVMSQSTFRWTHLKEAQLSKARCSYCDFEGANLALSDLSGAMLDYASFDRAVLTDANFQCTPAWPAARPNFFLRIGDFPFSRHASVSRASFSDAVGIDKADLSDVKGDPIGVDCRESCCACAHPAGAAAQPYDPHGYGTPAALLQQMKRMKG